MTKKSFERLAGRENTIKEEGIHLKRGFHVIMDQFRRRRKLKDQERGDVEIG